MINYKQDPGDEQPEENAGGDGADAPPSTPSEENEGEGALVD
jgi:hypothetical protein